MSETPKYVTRWTLIYALAWTVICLSVSAGVANAMLKAELRAEIRDTHTRLERRLNRMQTELNQLLQWQDTANVYLPFSTKENREKAADGILINHELSRKRARKEMGK